MNIKRLRGMAWTGSLLGILLVAGGCGGNEAVRRGVGAECNATLPCQEMGQSCLAFKGGYCGVQGCTSDTDCPQGSACVTHTDAMNYCFLVCSTKEQCNVSRTVDNESNCSSSTTFVDGAQGRKACIPPSASP